jgi:MSHA type pilus biogenesis protein MshL
MNPSTTIAIGGDMLGSSVENSGVVGKFEVRAERKAEITDVWAGIKAVLEGIKSVEGIIHINRTTGIIYMADSPHRIAAMVDFLDSLNEILNRQVFIDAQIMEVRLSDINKYGVDWSKMAIAVDRNNLLGFDDFQASFNGGSMFTIADRSSMGAVVDFLETQGDVSVLSNPHLSVMNGQSALMVVGVQFPYGDISGIDRNAETGVTTFGATIKRAILGLQLGITPQISSNGLITLHIVPTITSIRGQEQVELPTSATTNQSISNPVIDLKELSTRVRVTEGNTIILAGLISQTKQVDNQSMPILGYIPFLKYLFKHMETTTENRELVIFITPYLRSPT